MPKTIISDSVGVKVVADQSGLQIDSALSLSTTPTVAVQALTAASTLVNGGVYTVSSSAALTTVMPLASSTPGSTFVFRCVSAHAHIFTGSQETAGTLVFAGQPGTTPETQGSRLTLPATVGSSVALISDGLKFLVMAASGSATVNGT